MQRAGAGIADFKSPGVIGASMFPPRPARGYRFHSLHVEIIAGPSQLLKLQPFLSNHSDQTRRLCWNLNALLQKIGAGNLYEITLSWMPRAVTDIAIHPPQIVAKCCSFVSPASPKSLPTPLAHHGTAGRFDKRLRDWAAGRKIGPLHKK